MTKQEPMLQGVRVLDFSHYVAGPTCTRILAELGAYVIKIERSPEGDHVRRLGLMADGISTYYFQHNHTKRSLGVDVRCAAGLELLYRLVPKVDVVVENFAPGVIGAIGLGYEKLSALNPRLVMCSISVAGQSGPLSHKPGYDYIGAAYAGVADLLGEPDRPPIVPTMAIGDISTGVAAAMAVGMALFNRERTGHGQLIDASLLDTYFHMHEFMVPVLSARPGRYQWQRSGSQHPTASPYGIYRCRNGYLLLIVQQHEMERLARAMGTPELAKDPRFVTPKARLKNNQALKEIIERWLDGFADRDAAVAALEAERVPCAPVLGLEEAMALPHLRQRGTVRRADCPGFGELGLPGMPVRFSNYAYPTGLKVSRVGEDNEVVLREILELSQTEIAGLYDSGALLRAAVVSESQKARRA
ncbi:MAG: CoA transferase [Deltaproteobacteria bacterium]|jgi:CoA:oxalate CoA-transferase|nr:CoA transferase [Deltaproteobacteria bacterium]